MHTDNNTQTLIQFNTIKPHAHRKQRSNTHKSQYNENICTQKTTNTHTRQYNGEELCIHTRLLKHSKHSYKSTQRRTDNNTDNSTQTLKTLIQVNTTKKCAHTHNITDTLIQVNTMKNCAHIQQHSNTPKHSNISIQ